jgi:hypothetical protein
MVDELTVAIPAGGVAPALKPIAAHATAQIRET